MARQTPLPMEFSRQEYWSGVPLLPPGYLSALGIELESLLSPALQEDSYLFFSWLCWVFVAVWVFL